MNLVWDEEVDTNEGVNLGVEVSAPVIWLRYSHNNNGTADTPGDLRRSEA